MLALVSGAYDECLAKRDQKNGILERIASHSASFREYYDCGMIEYLGLMFSMHSSEEDFIADLTTALSAQSRNTKIPVECLLLNASCRDPAIVDMSGDVAHLRSRRAWLINRISEYVSLAPETHNLTGNEVR